MNKKTNLMLIGCVLSIILLFSSTGFAWLDGFDYRKPITINYTTNISDYQKIIQVNYTADMQTDFADIRFADINDNNLSYWIENQNDGINATVWVKTDVNTTSIIYMYYENTTSVSSESNGETTFDDFDDFPGSSLNISKWTSSGTITVSNSEVSINQDDTINSKTFFSYGYIAESKAKADEQDIAFIQWTATGNDLGNRLHLGNNDAYANVFDRMFITEAKTPPGVGENDFFDGGVDFRNTYYKYRIERPNSSYVKYCQEEVCHVNTDTTYLPTVDLSMTLDTWDSSQVSTLTVDWARVRKYAPTEPTYTVGAEESRNNPVDINITSPTNTTYYTSSISVSININETDSTSFSCNISEDGTFLTEITTNTIYTDTLTKSVGTHNISVSCEDSDNQTSSATTYYYINALKVTLISPVDYYVSTDFTPDFNYYILGFFDNYTTQLFLNHSGYGFGTGFCYQGSATANTSCGGLDTGSYTYGNFDLSSWEDIVYTIPIIATNLSIWELTTYAGSQNITIPSDCWERDGGLKFRLYNAGGLCHPYCHQTYCERSDSSFYELLSNDNAFVTEDMYWSMNTVYNNQNSTITSNISISPGIYEWYINATANEFLEQSDIRTIRIDAHPEIINFTITPEKITYTQNISLNCSIYDADNEDNITTYYRILDNTTETYLMNWSTMNYYAFDADSVQHTVIISCMADDGYINTTIQNISKYIHKIINITAWDKNNNSILNFTTTVNGSSQNTTTGYSEFAVMNGSYYITIDAPGYEFKNDTVNISNIHTYYNFSLYTTNSISFTFKDEDSGAIVDDRNITVELISLAFSSNYSTSDGTLYVDVLSPTEYTIRYSAEGYSERFYYFNLGNRTHTDLTLYLINATTSTDVTATVYDQNNNLLENVYIKVLRYDINTNSYIIQEIVKTNFEGVGVLHIILNDEFYRFILEYDGEVVDETTPSYIYATTITFQVLLGSNYAETFYNINDINYYLTFNNDTNNFRYTFSDTNNIVSAGCLQVQRVSLMGYQNTSTNCVNSSSGTILIGVTNTSGVTYKATGYVYFGDEEVYLISYLHKFVTEELSSDSGLFYVVLLMILFAFVGIWSPAVAVILTPLALIFGELIGLIHVGMMYLMPIEILAIIIAYMMNEKG